MQGRKTVMFFPAPLIFAAVVATFLPSLLDPTLLLMANTRVLRTSFVLRSNSVRGEPACMGQQIFTAEADESLPLMTLRRRERTSDDSLAIRDGSCVRKTTLLCGLLPSFTEHSLPMNHSSATKRGTPPPQGATLQER